MNDENLELLEIKFLVNIKFSYTPMNIKENNINSYKNQYHHHYSSKFSDKTVINDNKY